MDASYAIAVEPARLLVRMRLTGFFADPDIAGFRAACAREYPRLGAGLNRHLTLVDLSAIDIQGRESLDAFAALLADARFQGRRIAFVVAPSLSRSQARRIASARNAAFFDDATMAEAWLFADEDASKDAA